MVEVVRHVIVTGRVQGVGYRAWVSDEAAARKLRGWVRNRRDGSVEAVFAGSEPVVSAMVADCRQGPSFAKVHNVVAREAGENLPPLRGAEAFAVLPTI